ncbi:MAG: putative ATP-grasp-modified RiPP [Pseudonocardia sp.]
MPVVLPVTVNDPLFRTADQIPLGRRLGLIESTDAVPSSPEVRPFGLCFATTMSPAVMVDLAGLRYDPHRQIGVDDTGAPVFGKHSTGKTNTRTSDGHQSMDSDTDHTED